MLQFQLIIYAIVKMTRRDTVVPLHELGSGTYTGVSCHLSLVLKPLQTHCRNCPVHLVQHRLHWKGESSVALIGALPKISHCHPSDPICTVALRSVYLAVDSLLPCPLFQNRQRTSWWVCPVAHETTTTPGEETVFWTLVKNNNLFI